MNITSCRPWRRPTLLIAVVLFVLLAGPVAAGNGPPVIDRIEPPFWYPGFRNPELQLMIHGDGVSRLRPEIDAPGITIARVEQVDSPNYLFVYLLIGPDVPAGAFDIRFSSDDAEITRRYALHPRRSGDERVSGFSPKDAIYLVTPDRFANGDPDNDAVEGYGDLPDRTEGCGRHGGDITGLRDHLDYIRDLGFTAVWLNPVLENRMPWCSYHGYATTDFYRVDPRYGSNDGYRAFAEQARSQGIGLIMDMIVNHIGTGHWWMDELPDDDWLNFPERRPITTHKHVTQMDPYASAWDRQAFTDGWFVDTMPDLNQRHPLLADYLVQNALWWIEYLGLAGVRHDTHPYPDKHFMTEWTRRITTEYPGFTIVGEEWHASPMVVAYWQKGKDNADGYRSYLPSLMDFPLQNRLAKTLVAEPPDWGSSWDPLYETLAMDSVYPDPFGLVIFLDNHDMDRAFTQVREDADLMRVALVWAATMRGIPQVYYGTEILKTNEKPGEHGEIRSDMPGGWAGDAVNAFTGQGLDDDQLEFQQFTRRLFRWRRQSGVIHNGRLMQFTPIGETWVYFRFDDDDTVMVILNKDHEPVSLKTGRFAERLGEATSALDVLTGEAIDIGDVIELAPRSARILEIKALRSDPG